ncbi:30S ribosomal protein S15 [Spiroplasma platyhelix]|uniref:Small ribosomal subunit protein uS15 n=1 Tax=Spiroplasma platyhelix PALS-1 TaxID=1276218 RepID=A0A846TWE9_9MOLU|nr:30S ribosomal protein S15 [Spiroplasma platyhelix]MBE4703958.1 30S ribosomal protein S15 [Spiroplasma platyhelix PALS-1]NKE38331.1 30S ribosomal protein S15 [Spiroplasma platyhelix PALS-1]UJB29216.1 30S ribosomal protein S15 [Spiroplasma platyhelix PALS-1]
MDEKTYESLIKEFRLNDKDTGSTAVQIINLTRRILELTEHVKVQKKDVPAKRTLLKLVATRKTYLKYLKTQSLDKYSYEDLIKALGLKR